MSSPTYRTGTGSFQHTQAVMLCDQMTSGTVASRIRQMAHNQLEVTSDSADTTARWPPLAKKKRKVLTLILKLLLLKLSEH